MFWQDLFYFALTLVGIVGFIVLTILIAMAVGTILFAVIKPRDFVQWIKDSSWLTNNN